MRVVIRVYLLDIANALLMLEKRESSSVFIPAASGVFP